MQETLRLTEIFHSLQGESSTVGIPTVFVRLTGCPLRCQYCDTAYAFSGGKLTAIEEIIQQVKAFECPYICVTGGEPLAQPNCHKLLSTLTDLGYHVSLETSGAIDIQAVDKRVRVIMDLKTPGSKECDKNRYDNIKHLKPTDEVKFVLCSQDDYRWAKEMLNTHELDKRCHVLFSPSFTELNPQTLANWVVEDKLPVRFQLQLHKILWNDAPGH